jgi:membrane protease YdiL (CAAX protease family)
LFPVPPSRETLIEILAWLCLAAFCGLVVLVGRSLFQTGRPLPPQRHRAVPWNGVDICLAVLLYLFVPYCLGRLLLSSGILDWVYGIDFTRAIHLPNGAPDRRFAATRLNLWSEALALPVLGAGIPLVFHVLGGTRPYQLGLTFHRGANNALTGVKAWLVVTPVVFGVNLLVTILYGLLVDQPPDQHPVTRLVEGRPPGVDWVLMVFLAVAAAPVLEELLFRGVLQPWLARRPWGGDAALAVALAWAFSSRAEGLARAIDGRDPLAILYELGPGLFVLALVPGYLLVDRVARRQEARRSFPPAPPTQTLGEWYQARINAPAGPTPRNTARALYGTAVLFAAVHSSVWPSPIPLFVLALALGWLAYRTQSLVAPVVLHALFNSLTCVMLVLSQGLAPEPEKGKKTTSAGRRPPSISTSTAVPGVCWPRRR